MKSITHYFLAASIIALCASTNQLFSQSGKKVVPLSSLIERDVMWKKRTWRTLDLKEKMNHPFYFPTESYGKMNSLFTLIKKSISSYELTVYDAINDEFTVPLENKAALSIGSSTETIYFDNEYDEPDSTVIESRIESSDVMRFRLKEEWFFDRQRSTLEVRIIGICPVAEMLDSNGDYKGELPMYWIYFPEVRPLLANQETINRWNDAEQRSYDDLFIKRFFSSYIYKESNVYNRNINEYKIGTEALLEAQNIMNKISNLEQDLWEY